MSTPSFASVTITRLRYPTRTDHGTTITDYTATPATFDIDGCWAEPSPSTEVADHRFALSTGWIIAAPPGIDLTAADHVRHQGIEYEIDGEPLPVPSPTGALDYTRIVLKKWEG